MVIAAVALFFCRPLAGGFWHSSHEWIWYPVRLVEYVEGWKAGALYPRWCPDLYGGYGYPFFNYYAPGLYATAAVILELFSVGATVALKLAVLLFALAGGLAMYGLIHGETGRLDAALLGAVAFVLLPYRCTDVFTRGDLAEFAAFSLVPAVLWGYRALGRANERRLPLIGTLTAIAHAATILTHTITGLYTTEIVAVLLFITFLRGRNATHRRRALLGGLPFLAALGMASVYAIPALLERSLVHLENINSGAFRPAANMVNWHWPIYYGFFSVGAPAEIGIGMALLCLIVPHTRRHALALARWWLPAVLFLGLTITWAAPIWTVLPLGSYIQFPWRLLGFVGVFSCAGLGVVWAITCPARWRIRWVLCLLAVAAVVHLERPYLVTQYIAAARIPLTPASIRAAVRTSVVANEYLPATALRPPIAPRTAPAIVTKGSARLRIREVSGLRYELDVTAATASAVDMQIFDFPGWHVRGGGANIARSTTPAGLLRLEFLTPGSYHVRVWFGLTWLRGLATLVSWLSLLLIFPLLRRFARGTASPA